MKKRLGIILILITIIVTWMFWIFIEPSRAIPRISEYSQFIACCALVLLGWINFISTRHKALDTLFNGIDKSYIYHKYLSITVFIMVFAHNLMIGMAKRSEILAGKTIPRNHFAMYGAFSMYLFLILIIFAILAKKLNYERWKTIHKIMILPYAFGLVHYYGSSNYATFSTNAFSIWMNIINCIGLLSLIYSIIFYEKTSFKYHFKISKLEYVANGMMEITGHALESSMEFQSGQFAFLKTLDGNNKFPSHPFTISQAPKRGEIQFTIKGLGDHTKVLLDKIKVGDEFKVSGPHGKFNYKTGTKNQIWIAGGIGITPFRSFSQSNIDKDYSIDFFYAYNNKEEGAYVEELKSIVNNDNLRLHLHNSEERGFLSLDEISKYIKTEEPVDVYFCGPKPMRENLKKQFKKSNINVSNFHYEQFQFK